MNALVFSPWFIAACICFAIFIVTTRLYRPKITAPKDDPARKALLALTSVSLVSAWVLFAIALVNPTSSHLSGATRMSMQILQLLGFAIGGLFLFISLVLRTVLGAISYGEAVRKIVRICAIIAVLGFVLGACGLIFMPRH